MRRLPVAPPLNWNRFTSVVSDGRTAWDWLYDGKTWKEGPTASQQLPGTNAANWNSIGVLVWSLRFSSQTSDRILPSKLQIRSRPTSSCAIFRTYHFLLKNKTSLQLLSIRRQSKPNGNTGIDLRIRRHLEPFTSSFISILSHSSLLYPTVTRYISFQWLLNPSSFKPIFRSSNRDLPNLHQGRISQLISIFPNGSVIWTNTIICNLFTVFDFLLNSDLVLLKSDTFSKSFINLQLFNFSCARLEIVLNFLREHWIYDNVKIGNWYHSLSFKVSLLTHFFLNWEKNVFN